MIVVVVVSVVVSPPIIAANIRTFLVLVLANVENATEYYE